MANKTICVVFIDEHNDQKSRNYEKLALLLETN
jgi:hypothetical protein